MPNKIEIRAVLLARSLQMYRSASGTIGYLPDVVEEIKAKYGFLAAPKNQEILDTTKGAEFRHGRLTHGDRVVVIDRFAVFNDGIVADAASSTDDTDLFIDDVIQWAKSKLPKATPIGPRLYLSNIEIGMQSPLGMYTPTFESIGEMITTKLSGYGINASRYNVTNISLYFDSLGKINPQPGVFFIDRRLNAPHDQGVWFTQAPLKTTDHVALLREIEKI